MRDRYSRSPVRLVLDPTGAVARYVGLAAHPSYRWLDRRGRRLGPVRFSFALAVRR